MQVITIAINHLWCLKELTGLASAFGRYDCMLPVASINLGTAEIAIHFFSTNISYSNRTSYSRLHSKLFVSQAKLVLL